MAADVALGLGDLEAERVEGEVGGQPDVPAAVGGQPGAEDVGVRLARGAVDTVGGDDQVVLGGQLGRGRRLRTESQLDAQLPAPLVQYGQQPAPPERREAVA